MSENTSSAMTHRLTSFHIALIAVVTQLAFIPYLWGHTSNDTQFLGRYSIRYGAGLVAAAVVSLLWFIVIMRYRPIESWLRKIPTLIVIGLLLVGGIVMAGLFEMGIDAQLLLFLLANGFLAATLLILLQPDRAVRIGWWRAGMIVGVLVFYALLFISYLVLREYSPDEAWWADRANTFRLEGQFYARIAFYRASPIEVGRGWIGAVYSWLLDHVAFDIRVGRIFNQLMYWLAIGGIGLVTAQLYDRATAFASMMLVIVSTAFFRVFDFRADHFVAVGQTLAFFAVIRGQQGKSKSWLWAFAAGLIITLSLQIHLVAVTFAIGLSIFYAGNLIMRSVRQRRLDTLSLITAIGFGIGALIGIGIYYAANVLPNGGLQAFLDVLAQERGTSVRKLSYILGWRPTEKLFIWGAFAYLIWRRNPADRLYLTLTLCSILGIAIADTQGYVTPYVALLFVPAGVPLVQGLQNLNIPRGANWHSVSILICAMLVLGLPMLQMISWSYVNQTLRTGTLPVNPVHTFGEAVVERVPLQTDETVVATFELIWVMPDKENFYAPIAEGHAEVQLGWTGTQVWDYLQPDVYIEVLGRMLTPPGLQAYLEREQFQICDEFQANGYDVTVYRRVCSEEENG